MSRRNKKLEKAVENLMTEYGNDVLRIAYVYLHDVQLAEDAFQEVFLKVYKSYNSFRHDSSVKTWLISITRNVCKDMLRKNWQKRVVPVEDDRLINISDEGEDLFETVSNQALFDCILELDEQYKEAIILYYYQGFKIPEIASILDTTTGNVSSLLARARKKLKAILSVRWLDE